VEDALVLLVERSRLARRRPATSSVVHDGRSVRSQLRGLVSSLDPG
jgi:hypothetical protein